MARSVSAPSRSTRPNTRIRNASPEEHNRLLSALPALEYASLLPVLELIPLNLREVLYEAGAPLRHAYFPQHGVASLIVMDGATHGVEVARVGREGMVGMALFQRLDSSAHQCLVQIAGIANRIPAKALLTRLPDLPKLQRLLHRYAAVMFDDAAQTVLCNRRHTNVERCARWLLVTDDSVRGAEFVLTQEFLSYMLAVRRADVSIAAGQLQKDGLIRYSRGVIRVLDRVGLNAAACECYHITSAAHERVYE